jgi:catechol-2,3-dioxygenase
MPFAPVRLNHAVLYVAQLDRALRFYTGTLGMEVVSHHPPAAAFLRLPRSGNHHDLGLFAVGSGSGSGGGPRRRGPGLYHLAWQVDTIEELVEARRLLVDAGALVGQSDHGASKSLYGADPDGNELEVMWMVPPSEWDGLEHTAPVRPLDLDADLARWAGVRTAGRIEHEPVP